MIELMQHMHRIAEAAANGIGKSTHGVVYAVDPTRHSVQVEIMPEGNVSGWIPDPGAACGDLRISSPCEVGTHVLLEAVEGDAENYVIFGRLYDASVLPGVSPQTSQPAQPGEWLLMTGQGSAPKAGQQTGGQPASPAAWMHVMKPGVYAGIGTTKLSVEAAAITLAVGSSASAVLNSSSLKVTLGSSTFTFTEASLAALGASITSDKTVTGQQDVLGGGEPVSLVTHVHVDAGGTGNSGPPA